MLAFTKRCSLLLGACLGLVMSGAVSSAAPNGTTQTRSWNLPFEHDGGTDQDLYIVRDLTINENGTRALVKCHKSVICFDLQSGRVLQTYKPEADPYNKDPRTSSIFLSPDARFVASFAASPESEKDHQPSVVIREAETGRELVKAKLEHDLEISGDAATFSRSGETLILPGRFRGRGCAQLISTVTGTTKLVTVPSENDSFRLVMPVPGEQQWMVFWLGDKSRTPSRCSVVDWPTLIEKHFQSITVTPFVLFYDRGVTLSPDGKFLLVTDPKKFQISDWHADRLLFERTESDINYTLPRFTPDGTRFIVQRTPLYVMMHFGGPNAGQKDYVPPTIELYDVASHKKLADYQPTKRAAALAFSGDGHTLAYGVGETLYAADFRKAFGVDPLRPVAPVSDVELPTYRPVEPVRPVHKKLEKPKLNPPNARQSHP